MNNKHKNTPTKSFLSLAITAAVSSTFMVSAYANKNNAVTNDVLEENIEVITVTATRSALNINDALTSQIVIDRQAIERINPVSVIDLLSTVPSIDIASNGGKGQSASVFMRGTSSDHTLVLIDGVRISSATSGGTNLNTLSPALIERIEIVQGPRAALWGSDAIGGVIQIFTRKLDGGDFFAGASIGSDNYRKYQAGVGIAHGDGQTSITVNHEESDGFDVQDNTETDDDGYEFTSIAVRGQQNVNTNLTLDWLFTADQGETEYDGGYQNQSDVNNYAWLVRANYETNIGNVINNTVAMVGQNEDAADSLKDGVFKGSFETRRNQFSLVNHSQFSEDVQLNVGIDHYQDDVSGSETSYEQTKRDTTGMFAHGLLTNNNFSYEATLRYDDVEEVDSEVSYNLGAGYNFSTNSRVVLNYGTGFKAPTFNDLYYPYSGNPELRSEYSDSIELFFETTLATVDTSIHFYHTDVDDLIAWTSAGPENFEEVEISGAEFVASYLGFGGNHDFNASYTDAEDQKTHKQLIRRAKNKASYKFSTSIANADIYAEYQYVGKRTDRGDVKLDAYQVVNLGFNYAIMPELKLNARVTNLFDEEYQTANGYNTQEQAFYLGVTYQNF
ncbi:TonB-dependent receptor [Colwellia sp. D2M02]|uniref:TonB-dependent receptor domain-containing protein n=1 Tax=Colwellia sp. D2M02 TaxID=2841562 RepID=UPI001C0A6200|nr:TonB-dependent receptor [Colwellia sp. D2M02]MBU2892474.1 TonB-dependent receptor [Colwellia sp. D2M02]